MAFSDFMHSIGRAIDPAGPEVYDYNHHIGYYSSKKHRKQARFSRSGFDNLTYSPYYDEYYLDE